MKYEIEENYIKIRSGYHKISANKMLLHQKWLA